MYQRVMGISGTPLRDSFHLGQTDVNDFGRPYAGGFNNYSGFSARGHYGMFSAYLRGEFQHAPSWEGYPLSVAQTLAQNRRLRHLHVGASPRQYDNPSRPHRIGQQLNRSRGLRLSARSRA